VTGLRYSSYLFASEDGTVCSRTSAYKIHTPGNYPEESKQHSENGESLKSRKIMIVNLPTCQFHLQTKPNTVFEIQAKVIG
jgi:hypothetical protein